MRIKVFKPEAKPTEPEVEEAPLSAASLPAVTGGAAPAELAPGEAVARANVSAWKGLLWAEWFAHSKLLLIFLGLWLVGVWTLPLVVNPAWILILGGLYALLAGPAYGGGDILEGCEEFSFALPPTRSERFVARFAIGAGTVLFLTAINLLALGLDLPQVLARIYVETGLIKPRSIMAPGLLYGLVVALPWTVFSFSFSLAASAHSRWLIISAWFWGGLAAMTILEVGLWYEELVWSKSTGFFSLPFLVVAGVLSAVGGHHAYARKEIGKPTAPINLPGRWWLWLILFLMGMALASALFISLTRRFSGV